MYTSLILQEKHYQSFSKHIPFEWPEATYILLHDTRSTDIRRDSVHYRYEGSTNLMACTYALFVVDSHFEIIPHHVCLELLHVHSLL
jgi:hypothetical protein